MNSPNFVTVDLNNPAQVEELLERASQAAREAWLAAAIGAPPRREPSTVPQELAAAIAQRMLACGGWTGPIEQLHAFLRLLARQVAEHQAAALESYADCKEPCSTCAILRAAAEELRKS